MAIEHWYVLKVRRGFETLVSDRLRKRGVEAFVPEHKPHPQKAHIKKCLFPGYVFCRFALENQRPITAIPGVLCIMGAPSPTPFDGEFAVLEGAIRSELPFHVLPLVQTRERVRVLNGPMRRLVGSILEKDCQRYFAFPLKTIKRNLAFDCQGWSLEIIRSPRPSRRILPKTAQGRGAKRR